MLPFEQVKRVRIIEILHHNESAQTISTFVRVNGSVLADIVG